MILDKLEKYYRQISKLKIFISFCHKDICKAKFLYHILKYYNIITFFSPVNCEKGKIYPKEIIKNLKDSNLLLVIVTKNTNESKWVTKEIITFESDLNGKKIIPLMFDQVDLSEISLGLSKYEYIDFSDWTNGFTELLDNFGVKFLDKFFQDLNLERRHLKDRRSNDIKLRLQTTFWNYYSRIYNLGIRDEVKLNDRGFHYFCRSILPGAKKYLYYDGYGNLFNFKYVINLYAAKVWSFFQSYSSSKYARAIDLTILLSDMLTANYNVKWIDRRKDRRLINTVNYKN